MPVGRPPRLAALLLALAAGALVAATGGCADVTRDVAGPRPSPELSARDVVSLQLAALSRGDDEALAVALRFASPGNRAGIGEAEGFRQLLAGPLYGPLIGHRDAHVGPEEALPGHVGIPVEITAADGRRVQYLYLLRRQAAPGCENCWLIDAVSPFTGDVPRGIRT